MIKADSSPAMSFICSKRSTPAMDDVVVVSIVVTSYLEEGSETNSAGCGEAKDQGQNLSQ